MISITQPPDLTKAQREEMKGALPDLEKAAKHLYAAARKLDAIPERSSAAYVMAGNVQRLAGTVLNLHDFIKSENYR